MASIAPVAVAAYATFRTPDPPVVPIPIPTGVSIPVPALDIDAGVIQRAAQDCAPTRDGHARVYVTVAGYEAARVQSELPTATAQRLNRCMERRLARVPVRSGSHTVDVTWHNTNTFTRLDYPLPKASSRGPLRNVTGNTQEEVWKRIDAALRRAGYDQHLFSFSFLDGFAVATQPEKISAEGAPLFLTQPVRRFTTDHNFSPEDFGSWAVWAARRAFMSETARYQSFFFVCASGDIEEDSTAHGLEVLAVTQGTLARDPPRDLGPMTGDFHTVGFVYSFERREPQEPAALTDSVSFSERLSKANIEL